jgi:hypothetical protein
MPRCAPAWDSRGERQAKPCGTTCPAFYHLKRLAHALTSLKRWRIAAILHAFPARGAHAVGIVVLRDARGAQGLFACGADRMPLVVGGRFEASLALNAVEVLSRRAGCHSLCCPFQTKSSLFHTQRIHAPCRPSIACYTDSLTGLRERVHGKTPSSGDAPQRRRPRAALSGGARAA